MPQKFHALQYSYPDNHMLASTLILNSFLKFLGLVDIIELLQSSNITKLEKNYNGQYGSLTFH